MQVAPDCYSAGAGGSGLIFYPYYDGSSDTAAHQ